MTIHRLEVLDGPSYERSRAMLRRVAIQRRRQRRIDVGGCVSILFECRETVLVHVHEILRCEGPWTMARVARELDYYADLVPGQGELTATLMIEGGDAEAGRSLSASIHAGQGAVQLHVGGAAIVGESIERRADPGCPVHYLRFRVGPDEVDLIDDYRHPMRIAVRGEPHLLSAPVPFSTRSDLAEQLRYEDEGSSLLESWGGRLALHPTGGRAGAAPLGAAR